MAATNNDLLSLLNTIRSEMATKSDVARLHWENAALRAENEAQTSQLRCLRTDVANLRAEVEDLRTKLLYEMWEGIGETKEDVARWGVSTQQEVWNEGREIKRKMGDIKDAVAKLAIKAEDRDEEAEELNGDFIRVINRIERVEERVDTLAEEFEAPRKDSGVSFAEKEEQKKKTTPGLWFANGY